MSDTPLTPYASAWLTAQRVMEETGLTESELARVDVSEYARLTGRLTVAQIAQAAYTATTAHGTPPPVTGSEAAAFAPLHAGVQGIDLDALDWASMDASQYARLRAELGIDVRSAEGMQRHPGFTRVTPTRSIYGYTTR
ncbi:MAG TPA: hypothetical protein VMU95_00080 [Trebonia sp.]|nr:hypothetical protein [Trebonia sp.]